MGENQPEDPSQQVTQAQEKKNPATVAQHNLLSNRVLVTDMFRS